MVLRLSFFFVLLSLLSTMRQAYGTEASDNPWTCQAGTLTEIESQVLNAYREHYPNTDINQGNTTRVEWHRKRSTGEISNYLKSCEMHLSDHPNSDEKALLKWVIAHEVNRLHNGVLLLPFSTVYSWLDQYKVAVNGQTWQSEGGRARFVEHLRLLPLYVLQMQEVLRDGVRRQQTQSCEATLYHVDAITHEIESERFSAFLRLHLPTPSANEQALITNATSTLQAYLTTLVEEYKPHCRVSPSVSAWVNGLTDYAQAISYYTSTSYSPDEIHAIGLNTVDALLQKVEQIRLTPSFLKQYPSESVRDLFALLSQAPELGFDSADTMLQEAKNWISLIRSEQRGGFMVEADFPELHVASFPEAIARSSAEAMYQTGSDGLHGTMFINTAHPKKSRKYALPSAVLHEGFPGHHYQVFTRLRDNTLSDLRRQYYFHALGEGWALYVESFAPTILPELRRELPHPALLELGVLSYDLLRAARLVVDTGLHAKGWSRDDAVRYLLNNTAITDLEARNAVERFISLPAQATSYMIGKQAILKQKERAIDKLGENFSLQEFNQAVIKHSTLPVVLFHNRMDAWLDSEVEMSPQEKSSKQNGGLVRARE